jgi:hypothetical protein
VPRGPVEWTVCIVEPLPASSVRSGSVRRFAWLTIVLWWVFSGLACHVSCPGLGCAALPPVSMCGTELNCLRCAGPELWCEVLKRAE